MEGIETLKDLNRFNTAPSLDSHQKKSFLFEISRKIVNSDWVTIGIMATSDKEAIYSLKSITNRFNKIKFNDFDQLQASGDVFLKANQKTGKVYLRSDNGLGNGILVTCQYDDPSLISATYGPFPLSFFH